MFEFLVQFIGEAFVNLDPNDFGKFWGKSTVATWKKGLLLTAWYLFYLVLVGLALAILFSKLWFVGAFILIAIIWPFSRVIKATRIVIRVARGQDNSEK